MNIRTIALLLMMLTLTACENTVHGLGKDLQKNGEAIQRSTQ